MYEKIDKILEKFKRQGHQVYDNSYETDIYEVDLKTREVTKEYNLEEEIEKVFKEIGITQYDFCVVGCFDSPGYSLNCMCIAYIDLEGRLQTIPINYEFY